MYVSWAHSIPVLREAIVRALDALGAITGNVGVPGGSVAFEVKRRAFDLSFLAGNAPRRIREPQHILLPEAMSLANQIM